MTKIENINKIFMTQTVINIHDNSLKNAIL